MSSEFKCYDCEIIFEAEGRRKEYRDPVFGPCSKTVAVCPVCKEESVEYRKPKPVKVASASNNLPPCAMGGSCGCM